MRIYEISSFRGGISDYSDKGIPGAFKFGHGIDIRKTQDTLSCNQAILDEGQGVNSPSPSVSPSASQSPSSSPSPSSSLSISPSSSVSESPSYSASTSPSASVSVSPSASSSPSASVSPSASRSPSSSVSRSNSPSAVFNTVFRDLILWFVPATDGNLYGFGNTGYVYKRDSDGYWAVVYKAQSKIKGAWEKPSDDGKTYLIFALDTELLRKELPGLSNWNDVNLAGATQGDTWPKTNLTSTDWHTMKDVGGALLIANHSYLALVGYDNSYTNEALDLIPGNIAKTLVERDGRVIIGSYRLADPDKGINGAIDAEVPLAQVGDDGEIFFANMADSMPIKRFPGGGKVNPGGVCNQVDQVNFFEWDFDALSWIDKQSVGNLALFGVFNADTGYAGIYSLGRKNKNHPFVLNLEYKMEIDEIGAIVHYEGKTFASYRDGVDFGVKATSLTSKGQAVYEGLDFKAPVKTPIEITTWSQVEVLMKPLPTGTSISFWYKMNKTGDFVQAYTADGNMSFTTVNGKKVVFRIQAEGEIYEPRLVLTPSGNTTPEVHRIRTYFE